MSASDPVRIGINGYGRIGRCTLRAALENDDVEIVGINDIMDFEQAEYLTKYDSVLGNIGYDVDLDGSTLTVDGNDISLYNIQDPSDLPWDDLDVDVAVESTGIFRKKHEAEAHLDAGADKTLISAPPKGEEPVTQFVYGVNHGDYDGESIVSAASCTTNSVAPVAKVLDERFGIEAAQLTTVHSYTGSQALIDAPRGKRRRGRAAAENVVPTSTGAASATTEILPELAGKLDGMAVRVPTVNGSLTELVANLADRPDATTINDAFREAANGDLAGVLGYTDDEVVSRDILGLPFSSYVDLQSTNVVADGRQAKVLTWYDNEYGFACRMLDLARLVAG